MIKTHWNNQEWYMDFQHVGVLQTLVVQNHEIQFKFKIKKTFINIKLTNFN